MQSSSPPAERPSGRPTGAPWPTPTLSTWPSSRWPRRWPGPAWRPSASTRSSTASPWGRRGDRPSRRHRRRSGVRCGHRVNRHCASGLAVTNMAAAAVLSGMESAVVAGGVQSASLAPVCTCRVPGTDEWTERWISPSHPPTDDAPTADMSITVGWNAARLAGVTREAMDEWAYHSHRKAIEAIDGGRFDDEVIPVEVLRTRRDEALRSRWTSTRGATRPWRSSPR